MKNKLNQKYYHMVKEIKVDKKYLYLLNDYPYRVCNNLKGYRVVMYVDGRQQYLHRLIMSLEYNRDLYRKEVFDHIDSNGLNNIVANIKIYNSLKPNKYNYLLNDIQVDLKYQYLLDNNSYCISKGRTSYYVIICIEGVSKKLHRVISELRENRALLSSELIDHINHNGLDNRLDNLRICSNKQNVRNSRKQKNRSSIHKGVTWFKRDKKWKAQLSFNKKTLYLGYFSNENDAARAYNFKAIELFGEFANCNKIKQ